MTPGSFMLARALASERTATRGQPPPNIESSARAVSRIQLMFVRTQVKESL
jgi:hypothetical protein